MSGHNKHTHTNTQSQLSRRRKVHEMHLYKCEWVCWCYWRHLIGFIICVLTREARVIRFMSFLTLSLHFLFSFTQLTLSSFHSLPLTGSGTHQYHLLNILLLFFSLPCTGNCVTGKPSPSVIWFIGNEKIDDTYTVDHVTGSTVNEVSISPSLLSQRLLAQFNQLQEKYIQERHSHSSSSSASSSSSVESTVNKKASSGDDILSLINALPFLQITCQVYLDAILFPSSPPMSTSLRFDTNCKWAVSSVYSFVLSTSTRSSSSSSFLSPLFSLI